MEQGNTMVPAQDLIRRRISTRSFDGKALEPGLYKEIENLLALEEKKTRPFGTDLRLALIGPHAGEPAKLGTYGLISGAAGFVAGAVVPGPGAMEDLGYALEGVVLGLTALGLGSCWIGGVFDRKKTLKALESREGEVVPAVIALGRPSDTRSFADRLVTGIARSRKRKPLADILMGRYAEDPASLPEPILSCLEALRLAPSASNKQPWRIWVGPGDQSPTPFAEDRSPFPGAAPTGGIPFDAAPSGSIPFGAATPAASNPAWNVVFYLDEDKIYNNSLGPVHIQNVDMGIAMRHFEEAAEDLHISCRWGRALGLAKEKGLVPVGSLGVVL